MKLLKQFYKEQLLPVPRKIVVFPFVVALIGFADAAYLTLKHFQGAIPPCTTDGCEQVLTSAYSEILGVPVSLLGAIYYLAILVGLMIYLDARKEKILTLTLRATTIGFLMSLWFLFVQIFIIGSYCQYCLVSAATSIILFVTALVMFSKYRVPATLSE